MDIRVKSILDFIQSQKGYENTVIAGGAVRDYHYELEPRDYDIFFPIDNRQNVADIVGKISKEFNLGLGVKDKGKDYRGAQKIYGVKEFTFEGKVFDIIGKYAANDDQFGHKVVADFDFGNSMAFYNGLYIDDTNEYWKADTRNTTMTLVNLDNIANLPKAVDRYNRFNAKLTEGKQWSVRFAAPCLTIKNGKTKAVEKKVMPAGEIVWNPNQGAAPLEFPEPVEIRPVGQPIARRPWGQAAQPVANEVNLWGQQILNELDALPQRDAQGRFQRRDAGLAAGVNQLVEAVDQEPLGDVIRRARQAIDNRLNPVGEIDLPVRNNQIPMARDDFAAMVDGRADMEVEENRFLDEIEF